MSHLGDNAGLLGDQGAIVVTQQEFAFEEEKVFTKVLALLTQNQLNCNFAPEACSAVTIALRSLL